MSAPHRFADLARSHWLALVAIATLATLAGCGGGGGGGGTTPPPAPAVTLSPSSLTFSSQIVGTTSAVQSVTLTNSGTATLSITSISVTGDFAETNACGNSVSAGSNCTVNVTFTPTATGSRSGSVSIVDNASGSPHTVNLTGTGQAPGPGVSLSTSSLTFSSQIVGTTSAAQSVTLTNSGNASLIITSISATGDFGESDNCDGAVAAGAACTINVTFTPSMSGTRLGTISISDNAANTPQTIGLTGGGQVNNSAAVTVDLGPAGNDSDVLFVTVTVCVPGTQTCQSIDHVVVDTGSSGLRLLQSELTVSLPQVAAPDGNPLGNCVVFGDNSYMWGPAVTADIQVAGETTASSASFTAGVPIQVISAPGSTNFPSVPAACNSGGLADNTVENLGGNGLIGVSVFRQDCGQACAANPPQAPGYFSCPNSGCTVTSEPLLGQLQNPVWAFLQDNNGLSITLPQIPDTGQATASGTMTFGIGTQPDNGLGSATIYTTDTLGNFRTTYNGKMYTSAFIDSGSNGMYFLDSVTTGMPDCPDGLSGYYCPANTTGFTVTNTGLNGNSGPVTFKIANTETLVSTNPSFSAFNDLGGSLPDTFDFGLPFFFGRTIFVGIEGENVNGTNGPLWAY